VGLSPQAWSGFTGLYSLSGTMAYPSLFATALMFLSWDLFLSLRDGRQDERRGGLAGWAVPGGLALALALLVLVHPFTAVNAVLGLGASAESSRRADSAVLFAADTDPAVRSRIVDRHGIACVLADLSSPPLAPGALPHFQIVSTAGSVGLSCRR
jgi:hypothetical protein